MNTKETIAPAVKQAEVNGTKLAYIERGSGETVVFIHGAVSDYRTWSEHFNTFSDEFRVISYSRRGHFPNAKAADSSYTREQHTADLIEFLKALKIEKAHLIGHSYGASVALLAALQQPHLVGSLILGEPSPFPELLGEDGFALLAEQRAAFDKVIELAQAGDQQAAVKEFLHTVIGIDAFGLLPDERRAVVLENADTLQPMLLTYYDSPLVGEKLRSLRTPTMFVTGEISPIIARFSNKMAARHLPNAKVAVLKCASHGLQMENPEGFNQLVLDFLRASQNTDRLDEKSLLYSPIFNHKLS